MMMDNKEQLKKRIAQTELQLKKLLAQTPGSEVREDLCNSLILKKAVMKKDLENLNKNPILEKIKNLVPRKEKLICDYFN